MNKADKVVPKCCEYPSSIKRFLVFSSYVRFGMATGGRKRAYDEFSDVTAVDHETDGEITQHI